MSGYLIKDTTKEERQRIIDDSVGNVFGGCDSCMSGLIEMYQDYIDGKLELKEINMRFQANYEHGDEQPAKSSCGMGR